MALVQVRAKPGIGAAMMAAVIFYGSLYPFRFYGVPDLGDALGALLARWAHFGGSIEVFANILLYAPLGYYLGCAIEGLGPWVRTALVTAAGFAFSFSIELAQHWDLTRDSDMGDVWANTAGTFLGAWAAIALAHSYDHRFLGPIARKPFVALLLSAFLFNRVYPWTPDARVSGLRHTLAGAGEAAVFWLVACVLVDALVGKQRRPAPLVLMAAALSGRALASHAAPSAELSLGALTAAILWTFVPLDPKRRAQAVAVLFAAAIVFQSLSPFRFGHGSSHFGWVPFGIIMMETREVAIPSFLQKAFTWGALVWLPVRAGRPLGRAALAASALVIAIDLFQRELPRKQPEITDLVVLALMAANMVLMDEARPGEA